MNKKNILLVLLVVLFGSSCNQQSTKDKIITVTIEPQRYFAEQLADSLFEIVTMVPAGSSPETYDPSPVQMAKLSDSKAYFCIGHIGFEEVWMDKVKANNPGLPVFDNSKGMIFIQSEEECDHDHHHEGGDIHHHAHAGGIDPHTWSSPKKALHIVNNMYDAFVELDPDHQEIYKNNLEKLKAEINRTDSVITDLLKDIPNRSFIIYHPALSYFAEDYGLEQYCIEIDGKEPSPEILKRLVETSKEKEIKIIFIQQEFDLKNAEIIAKETGCKLVTINPLSYEWSKEMIHIAKALADE